MIFKCTFGNFCNFFKYITVSLFLIFTITSLIAHTTHLISQRETYIEKNKNIKICISHFIDSIKHKEILGEKFNIYNLCNDDVNIKLKYHLINLDKCMKDKYIGQSYNVFQGTLECRYKYSGYFLHILGNDFKEIFTDITPTLENILEHICDNTKTLEKLEKITNYFNCI